MKKKSIYQMTKKELDNFNKKNQAKTRKDYAAFKKDLELGMCWLCKKGFVFCDLRYPCQHWLLLPDRLRKRHLKNLFDKFTYDQLEGFLRWYVNAHNHARHINDLREEYTEDLARAITIKFDEIEWSLHFGKNCIRGLHGKVGPHYHVQIRRGRKIFHSFSDNHIKLSQYELWKLNIDLGNDPKIKRIDVDAAGIQDIIDNFEAEDLLGNMSRTDDPDKAQFQVQSLVIADEGHAISGDDIADIIEESKKTGIPMHQLIKRLKNVSTRVVIAPGAGIPDASRREKHRGKNKKRPTDDKT